MLSSIIPDIPIIWCGDFDLWKGVEGLRKLSRSEKAALDGRLEEMRRKERVRRSLHYRPYSRREGIATEFIIVLILIFVLAGAYLSLWLPCSAIARRMVCINNLYRLGVAMSLYTKDWDGRFPSPSEGKLNLPHVLDNYVDKKEMKVCKKDEKPKLPYPFICPARTGEPGLAYGLNLAIAGQSDSSEEVSNLVVLADIFKASNVRWWVCDWRFSKFAHPITPHACHQGNANFLFADMHAKSRKSRELESQNWILGTSDP